MLSWDESASDGWALFEDFRYHKTWPNFFRLATHLMSLPNRPHRFVSSKETFFPPQKLGRVVHSHGMAKHRAWSRWRGGDKKKTSSQEGNLCYVMIFFSCFWKQRQKRKAENSPRRENYFSFALSCAPRQKLWWKKEILFISKAHRESFMRLF